MNQFIKVLKRIFVTNWKTSICGLFVVVGIGGRMTGHLDKEDMQYLIGVAVAAGFFAAKDGVRDEAVIAPENTDIPENHA